MSDKAGPKTDATTGHQGGGRAGWPVDPLRLSRTLLAGRYWLLGIAAAGLIVGLLVDNLGMTSGYQTTAVLKYEGELHVAGLPPTNDAIGPAADALKRQAVLSKIREETGFEGSLTTLAAAIGYDMNLLSNTVQVTVGAEHHETGRHITRPQSHAMETLARDLILPSRYKPPTTTTVGRVCGHAGTAGRGVVVVLAYR